MTTTVRCDRAQRPQHHLLASVDHRLVATVPVDVPAAR
jgi:hypothetical protein